MRVCVFFTLTDRASTTLHPVLYAIANPERGTSMLDRKIPEEHLQSSDKEHENKQKRQKEEERKEEQTKYKKR